MNDEPPVEATETCGHDVELIEFRSPAFPPEAFPDRVRRGRLTTIPTFGDLQGRTAQDEIMYWIGDTPPGEKPDPTPPG